MWRWRLAMALGGALVACSPSSSGDDSDAGEVNLLAGLEPRAASGARGVERLTDGVVARPGDAWKTDLTTVLVSTAAFVEYDLGEVHAIGAAYLQADNNDHYLLSVSEDGHGFQTVWRSRPHPLPGMRGRSSDALAARGRYLRLQANRGDGSYSVSELQIFANRPAIFPPHLPARIGVPVGANVRLAIALFGAALIFLLLFTFREAPRGWSSVVALLPVAAGTWLAWVVYGGWPVGGLQISFLRAAVAAVAAVAVAREAFAPRLFAADRRVQLGVLATCAALAIAAFFNLGYPQFIDHSNDSRTAVHYYDMRVYYPVAKYFPELRFDGVYLASVAAYADDDPAVTLGTLRNATFRDLDTHRMVRVADVPEKVEAVPKRFTPERWQAFKHDMRYFRAAMGPEYVGSMRDHGGNATPFWLAVTHLMFNLTEASDATFYLFAALDPLLLLLTFLVIGRSFGWRTALVAAVLFGANDFYMFGSNWAGATLRHDWMAYLGLGICALKRERWLLAGALLGAAAMIRAFPAMALFALVTPALWWCWQHWRQSGALPSGELLRARLAPLARVYAGALAFAVVAFIFSGLVLDFSAWGQWLHKVSLLNRDAHVNHVSIRLLFDGLPDFRRGYPVLSEILRYLASAVATLALLWASRRRTLSQAATLGLCLVPFLLYPANYYAHFIFLLALVVAVDRRSPLPGRGDGIIWILLLLICVAQYGTVDAPSWGIHFGAATIILLLGLAGVLAVLIVRDRRAVRHAIPTSTG